MSASESLGESISESTGESTGESLRVAFQMDPPTALDAKGDSSYAIATAAQNSGAELFYYRPHELTLRDGEVTAPLRAMRINELGVIELAPEQRKNLKQDIDVVLMRQDPPFDMGYITATHILEHIVGNSAGDTLVVNDPASVRNAPEKLLVEYYHDLMPPSLISMDRKELLQFRSEVGDLVLKPLYGNGGEGIFLFKKDDVNFASYLESFCPNQEGSPRLPVIAQAYLEKVSHGDKRIILLDGEVLGAINRRPPSGEIRANMHIGGVAEKTTLNPRELEICARLKPMLQQKGLLFTGIDVIDGLLTEINVTSPTGLQELSRFEGFDAAAKVWLAIEAKLSTSRGG